MTRPSSERIVVGIARQDFARVAASGLGVLSRLLWIAAALALAGCTNLFFSPARDMVRTPAELGLAYEDVRFTTEDGETLHGWFLPAKLDRGRRAHGTVMFLHGRNRNISSQIASVEWLPERGFNVFLFDYRGYGESSGTPSLWGLQKDLDAGWKALLDRRDIDPSRIALFGQSMGGAVAIWNLAKSRFRDHAKALVTEGAFTSYRDVVRDFLATRGGFTGSVGPWLAYLVDGDYSAIDAMRTLPRIPVLIVHGENDRVVPVDHARALYQAATGPKELWIVPAAWHVGSFRGGRTENRDRLAGFLLRTLDPITAVAAHD